MNRTQRAEKILYLDFDGVLHHEDVYFHRRRGIYIAAQGRKLFEWVPVLEELLAPYPTVAIVLSTSWVRVRSFDYAKSKLPLSLQERVMGATFHHRYMREDEVIHLSRGEQIAQDVFRRGPKGWFALDDDYEGWPTWCKDKLIRTDGAVGISDLHVQHAVRIILERM